MTKTILLASLFAAAAFAAPADKPNVIFVLVDDLGWGDIGVFHQNARRASGDPAKPSFVTPSLDRLAAEGARLTHHYVGAPVCVSSRASLLQGVTQGHARVRDNQFDKALDENHTLATVLRQAGYATAAIGKWGLQGAGDAIKAPDWPAHPLNRGFDYYYGYIRHIDGHEHYPKEAPYFKKKAMIRGPVVVWENRTDVTAPLDKCYTTDLFTARAKKWIAGQRQSAPDKPFFLYLAYDTPHAVLELPTQAYPAGGGLHGGMQWLGTPGHAITTASGKIDSWIDPDYATATYDHDSDSATPPVPWPDVYRRWATSIRRIDDCVGDLVQLLKDLKIEKDTLIVFTSDNGPSMESYLPERFSPSFFGGFAGFDGIKRDLWEGGVRVPAIAHWPGRIGAGGVIATPTGTWDWLPTFAHVAGLPVPARLDGISLVPLLTGKGRLAPRTALYFEYAVKGQTPAFEDFESERRGRPRNQMQALRIGDLTAVRYDIKSADDDFEIYDVVTDPKETRNLASDPRFAARQAEFKALALQSRRPDPDAPRPYDAAFVPALVTTGTANKAGLRYASFAGDFPWVPAFTAMEPSARGTVGTPDLSGLKLAPRSGVLLTGYLRVPADGDYTFTLRADGGAVLRLHQATLIDADYGYRNGTTVTGTIKLRAGLHPLRLAYRTHGGNRPALELQWSGPGFASQPLPASALSHPSTDL